MSRCEGTQIESVAAIIRCPLIASAAQITLGLLVSEDCRSRFFENVTLQRLKSAVHTLFDNMSGVKEYFCVDAQNSVEKDDLRGAIGIWFFLNIYYVGLNASQQRDNVIEKIIPSYIIGMRDFADCDRIPGVTIGAIFVLNGSSAFAPARGDEQGYFGPGQRCQGF